MSSVRYFWQYECKLFRLLHPPSGPAFQSLDKKSQITFVSCIRVKVNFCVHAEKKERNDSHYGRLRPSILICHWIIWRLCIKFIHDDYNGTIKMCPFLKSKKIVYLNHNSIEFFIPWSEFLLWNHNSVI